MPPVSRIRLRIEQRAPVALCVYTEPNDPSATPRTVPLLRLTAPVRIAHPGGTLATAPERALIDTGAWLTAIETATWQQYDALGLIEHLPFAPGTAPDPCKIGGNESAFRLGRLHVAVLDWQSGPGIQCNWLPAVPVTATLLEDPNARLTAPFLLGLHLGVLDGRKLTRAVVPPQPAALSTDCGSHFAQQWFLETP
jgi:hypothetical protein